MLLNLKQLVSVYDMHIFGVIHVGAHYGQEVPDYLEQGATQVICIEPARDAFKILRETYKNDKRIKFFNVACGATIDQGLMYSSPQNQGMSNSLLKPAIHTTQYPDIRFTQREEVEIRPLDGLEFHRPSYNMLAMDVQGYELHVLRGASYTLKHIDYIYTEVNRAEVYKGCAQVNELQAYLSDFTMVQVDWAGKTWGDALFINNSLL